MVIQIILQLFNAYQLLLVLYALMSWLPGARQSSLGQLVARLVRPYLDIFDRIIPPIGGISFNVIIALFVLQLIQRGLLSLILSVMR
ncbi:YggT family protein [Dolosicoccus paucivorans]|uniref:YggT family protein n=1 Tax=Dolosicoccus paucivorans TaxID=84521 RepID=A0A1G8L919_9LACT|nr:YggT family protein [Dolosicoccus paucivorans]PMB84893.1 YggT family protein [Dolosicoccus paucivorans]PMC58889.1 YggT family protein [Dolosicoccus paucivorans]SDI51997.1 YggT family protein [Dolosicoccus paucivorans]